jgi:malic enzyme
MVFDRNEKKQVVALLGAGSMGTAIVRRIAAGKKILPEHIVALDMVGTGYAVDAFGEVMAKGGAGLSCWLRDRWRSSECRNTRKN